MKNQMDTGITNGITSIEDFCPNEYEKQRKKRIAATSDYILVVITSTNGDILRGRVLVPKGKRLTDFFNDYEDRFLPLIGVKDTGLIAIVQISNIFAISQF